MRRLISLDTETELIARGRQVPPLVVLSYAELDLSSRTPRILRKGLVPHQEARAFLLPLLRDPEVHITGANIAYDVLVTSAAWPNPDPGGPSFDESVLALWVAAYDADRVTDLLTRQKLLDLAAGCYRREQLPDGRWAHHKYNLAAVAWRLCRMRLDKGDPKKRVSTKLTVEEQARAAQAQEEAEEQDDSWRLRYAELKDTPISSWPAEARQYALDDAVAGALVYWEQESGRPHVPHQNSPLPDLKRPSAETEPYNIFSGSKDGGGLAAALTNPTELARRKGVLSQSYPLDFGSKTWPDLEAAWFELSLKHSAAADQDALMVEMVAAKFRQHPRLAKAVERNGGAAWLRTCSHFTGAVSGHMQAWEGRGEGSRFIRNLARGFERWSAETDSLRASIQQTTVSLTEQPGLRHSPSKAGQEQTGLGFSSSSAATAGPSAALWLKVRENFGSQADPFGDEHNQARGALWLCAMSAHGLRTDPSAVERFAGWVSRKHVEVTTRLISAGLVRVEWHLDKEALGKWVADRCVAMNVSSTGTKKAELLHLAKLLGEGDVWQTVALAAANWLQIIRALRGPRPEPLSLEEAALARAYAEFKRLEDAGLAHRTYHRDTKAAARAMLAACSHAGITAPRTESYDPRKHADHECVALDKEACQSVRDGDPDGVLTDYAELSHLAKILSADIPVLRSGTVAPIHTHFEELLETGRTGSSGPNVQNVARGDKDKPGARECYVPREYIYDPVAQTKVRAVLVDSDYSLGELHTLAQACLWTFGWSKLADVLRAGKDPHTVVACRILGLTYEEGVKLKKIKDAVFDNARNSGKAVNFGKPGGLSAKTMRAYAIRSYGVDLPEEKWIEILALWDQEWQEMPLYFRWIDGMRGKRGRPVVEKGSRGSKIEQLYNLVQPWSKRLRAGATYCSACNSVYQGLLADVAKRAGWYLFKACYLRGVVEGGEALYGCRPVNFIHDQFLLEVPEERGDAAAQATGLLMNRAGAEILPDVPVRCEPILARRWSKRAEEKREGGKLVAWEDARLQVADDVESARL